MQEYRIDQFDIYILRILAKNCRASYRSIGLALGITTNTVKNRIRNLINNKILSRYVLHINFAVIGYKNNCLLIVHNNTSPDAIIGKLSSLGKVYLHVDCLGDMSVFGIVFKKKFDELELTLSRVIRPAILRNVFRGDLESRYVNLSPIDLKIIKSLLGDPRMKNEDIAKANSVSQKTIKRRLELMRKNHVLDFGIVYNPSAMKGYIYFGLIVQTESYQCQRVLEEVYVKFYSLLLRHPQTVHKDVIVLNLYSRNICDLDSILKTAKSIEGVTKAEIFQTVKTEILDKWIYQDIDEMLLLK